jgi:hypothetical protein
VKIVQHVADGTLERYALQTLPESDAGLLEEHLLICQSCRDRLQTEIDYVMAMSGAAAKIGGSRKATSGIGRMGLAHEDPRVHHREKHEAQLIYFI